MNENKRAPDVEAEAALHPSSCTSDYTTLHLLLNHWFLIQLHDQRYYLGRLWCIDHQTLLFNPCLYLVLTHHNTQQQKQNDANHASSASSSMTSYSSSADLLHSDSHPRVNNKTCNFTSYRVSSLLIPFHEILLIKIYTRLPASVFSKLEIYSSESTHQSTQLQQEIYLSQFDPPIPCFDVDADIDVNHIGRKQNH